MVVGKENNSDPQEIKDKTVFLIIGTLKVPDILLNIINKKDYSKVVKNFLDRIKEDI